MDVVTVSRFLGHASPSVTLDKYGHALSDHQRSSVEKLESLYQGDPQQQMPEAQQESEEAEAYGFAMQF